MKKRRSAILLAAAAITGLIVFIELIPGYSIIYSINSRLNRSQAIDESEQIGRMFGVKLSAGLMQNTTFQTDGSSIAYLRSKVGTRRTNALMRADSIPLDFWEISWFNPSKQTTDGTKLEVQISASGRLLRFDTYVADSTSGVILDEASAVSAFRSYWKDHDLARLTGVDPEDWKMTGSEPLKFEHRQDWSLTFTKDSTIVQGLEQKMRVTVDGSEVRFLDLSYSPPDQFSINYQANNSPFVFMSFFSWLVIFVLFAVGLVIFLKRYNEGEAGIGSSTAVSMSYYVPAAIALLLTFPSVAIGTGIGTMNVLYRSLIVAGALLLLWFPLLAILTFSAWGVGESSSRAIWPEKLFAFDAASHLKIFNEKLGGSILRGFAFGAIMLGVYAVAHPIFQLHSSMRGFTGSVTPLDSYVPSVSALADGFATALFSETFYRFGVLSFFGKKRTIQGIAVSALLFIPSLFYPMPYGEYGPPTRILFSFALSAVLIFLFLRYDFVTVFVASALFCSAQQLIPVFSSSNSFFDTNSVIAASLLLLPVVVAFIGLWKKQPFELSVDLMPAHIRRISERERMARELEIAKNVQNELFPRTNPSVPQMEFGGTCIPALEVGGDYYDFIELQDGQIGTAIADVSGKGLPAAIYMTLTKGALLASAEDQPSPGHVLSKINKIVYNSISRGTFISMIYAVIDTKTRKVKFARAGHNPLALFSSGGKQAKLFTPNGLALGLDAGEKFDPTLEEMEITLQPGDALVFYTDGFTEAMDAEANEFGEDRLVDLIESSRHLPVKDMLEKIDAGVRKFAGNAPQHDDMTMVVIKVKQE